MASVLVIFVSTGGVDTPHGGARRLPLRWHTVSLANGQVEMGGRGRPIGGGHFTRSHFVKAEPASLVPQRGLGCTVRPLYPPAALTTTTAGSNSHSLSAGPRLVTGSSTTTTTAGPALTAPAAFTATSTLPGLTVGFTEAMLLILAATLISGLLLLLLRLVVLILGMAAAGAAVVLGMAASSLILGIGR